MTNTDLYFELLLRECLTEIMKILVFEKSKKLLCLYLVQHMLHQIKTQQFYTNLGFHQHC